MAKNKMTIDFKGFQEMFEKLDRLEADTKRISEKALQKSYDVVTPAIDQAIKPHYLTGQTEKSLAKNEKVEWEGMTAYIRVGFNISNGGLPSVFLMFGTPRIKPDKKLHDSIWGASTKKKVRQIQEEIFKEELKKVLG